MSRFSTPLLVAMLATAAPVSAATLSQSVTVDASPAAVWSVIGGFCAIKDWHPAIGACSEAGSAPPTRTLVTGDGKATFVEVLTGRSDREHWYSYAFTSSPLPVTQYQSRLAVTESGRGGSKITWSGSYVADAGKESAASTALHGIYEAGLNGIKSKLDK